MRARKVRREWRRAFLEGFQKSGTVTGGCEAAGISRTHVYRERQRDEQFALQWSDVDAG